MMIDGVENQPIYSALAQVFGNFRSSVVRAERFLLDGYVCRLPLVVALRAVQALLVISLRTIKSCSSHSNNPKEVA